jgi:glycosyltransferase involved in cell wall biosynthesis
MSPIGILPPHAGHRARIWALIDSARQLGHDVWFHGLGLPEEDVAPIVREFGEQASFSHYVRPRDMRPRTKGAWAALRHRWYTKTQFAHPVDFWFQDHWLKDLEVLARRTPFDTVVAGYVFASRGLTQFPSPTRKLIDTIDLLHEQPAKLAKMGLHSVWRRINARNERKGLLRCDVIVAIQEEEATAFRRLVNEERPVVTVGHPVHVENLWNPQGGALVLGYLATANELNVLSAKWFLSEVWPRVLKRVPSAVLLVAGTVCGRLAPAPGIKLLGLLSSPKELYQQVKLVINPMRTGSGLKIKTVEALGFGMPMVTTPEGAVGLTQEGNGTCWRVAEEPAAFAEQIITLLAETRDLAALSKNALAFAVNWNREIQSTWAAAI